MKLETFFEKFDLLAEAPGGVAKLRELVLELAVCGRLVPQDPSDVPARDLLVQIASRLSEEQARRQAPPEPPVEAEDAPCAIPATWCWVRFRDVAIIASNLVSPRNFLDFVHLAPDNIEKGTGRLLPCATVRDDKVTSSNHRFFPGQLVYSKIRPNLAKVVLVDFEGLCSADMYPIDSLIDAKYLRTYMLSRPFLAQAVKTDTRIAMPKINQAELNSVAVALPPLEEQRRIVAKVDALMSWCDQLEAQQQERETRRATLAQAALTRFAEAPTPANLTFLFHDSYTIDPADLRRAILSLAVQGRLVAQDSADESLDATFPGFVRFTGAERETLPKGWACSTYRALTTLVTSGSRGWKDFYSTSGAIFVRTQNIKTDRLVLDEVARVQLPEAAEGTRAQVTKGDILITITGANVTKAARVENEIPEAYVSQHIALTRPRWSDMSEWLHLCFISHGAARATLERLAYGDKPGLNLDNVRDLVMPIPPLSEQRRIAAMVDHLMASVDRLDGQIAAARVAGERLLEALQRRMLEGK